MQQVIAAICTAAGFQYRQHRQAGGGDINFCYYLSTVEGPYFLKLNDFNAFPGMFFKEAEGLAALDGRSALIIPSVIKQGTEASFQYLLMELLVKESPAAGFWQQFGSALATLHKNSAGFFGWKHDNYIGSLRQSNNQHSGWAGFYAAERILPLVRILFDKGVFGTSELTHADSLCNRFQQIFPEENPSLLHGDLWSGNFMVSKGGYAAVYDPAVYYGHREMDLGMASLFGGFPGAFFDAYHQQFPLENKWKERIPLTQLYPLLVHAILFGGGYIQRCREILNSNT